MKSKTTALILSILAGGLGIDRFYLGYTGMGILKLLTGGVFGIVYIIDIINIATGRLRPEDGSAYEEDRVAGITATPSCNPYEELQKIAELYKAGILSDEEFAKMKADCLAKMK